MATPTLAQFIASQAAGYETVREYIGARYVPVFANPLEWSDTRGYEPLTIVLHQGNSYTSMQAVPTGIDIGNAAFWALTGNYNAQVEAYRAEVQQYQQTVQGFDARITANTEAIATNTDDIETNIVEIADIKQVTNKISIAEEFDNIEFGDVNNNGAISITYSKAGENRLLQAEDNFFGFFKNGTAVWTSSPIGYRKTLLNNTLKVLFKNNVCIVVGQTIPFQTEVGQYKLLATLDDLNITVADGYSIVFPVLLEDVNDPTITQFKPTIGTIDGNGLRIYGPNASSETTFNLYFQAIDIAELKTISAFNANGNQQNIILLGGDMNA